MLVLLLVGDSKASLSWKVVQGAVSGGAVQTSPQNGLRCTNAAPAKGLSADSQARSVTQRLTAKQFHCSGKRIG